MRRPGLFKSGGNWTKHRGANRHTGKGKYPKTHWVECARCGFDVLEFDARKEWTGQIVCKKCLDHRQPQDFVRGSQDDTAVRYKLRPPVEPHFACSPIAIAGIAIAGCAVAGVGDPNEGRQNPSDVTSDLSTFNLETL